ncbi:unnamed protein product [Miscanthus lutarioriparius]|uniref:S1 motif domain-containing protein n=1 Tax=Miscanthus lutarioriparius TaxID=422564 RepID=A0A811S1Z0_9POAL|nr:unnamed protein product [Miscanthus lutarioriparius]
MLVVSLRPGPSLAAFPASARRSPVAFVPFPARLHHRPLLLSATAEGTGAPAGQGDASVAPVDEARLPQFAADWEAARAGKDQGRIFTLPVLRANSGGLIVRFNSLQGFVPNPLLSPAHWCKDPKRPIQDITKHLVGTSISVKLHSTGLYHLTGLVHISEVSWDLVQDVQDFLNEGDTVKVIVVNIDTAKSRIALSIRQLEEDPLLETLDKVIPLEADQSPDRMMSPSEVELLPGLDGICNELLQEDGITDVQFGRQGSEKRVVSQDLELWLSNAPAKDNKFTLLARAGRQVQEVYLTTSLDQEGIKKAVQRVLGVFLEPDTQHVENECLLILAIRP